MKLREFAKRVSRIYFSKLSLIQNRLDVAAIQLLIQLLLSLALTIRANE